MVLIYTNKVYKRVSFLLALIWMYTNLYSQPPQISKVEEWYQQGYYILKPVIANSGRDVAYACLLSGKDSTINSNQLLKRTTLNYCPKDDVVARQYDPVVCVFNINNKKLSLIDYGWSPVFSPNGLSIAYSFQNNPLKLQERLYADAYKGNGIKIFSTANQESSIVATTRSNYLLDPFFVDSILVAFRTGDKMNGAYGAAISLHEANLKTKVVNTIRPAAIKFRQYDLVGDTYMINGKLSYTMYIPTDSGSVLANQYLHILLSGKDTLFNFGSTKFTNLNYKFAFNKPDEIMILDDGHLWAEDTNFVVKYKGGNIIQKRPISFHYDKAFLSPNGAYMLYITSELEAWLVNLEDFRQTKINCPAKEFHGVVWSQNSDQLVMVQDHESLVGTDKLSVYKIK